MNWDAIGATGEIIGATAVVISLLYLGLQIRSQTRQAKFAAAHDISIGYREAMDHFSGPYASKLYIKALSGTDNLDDSELFHLVLGSQKMLRVWEEAFYLHSEGQLHGKHWEGINRQFRAFLDLPVFKYTWKMRSEFYGDEFRSMVEQSKAVNYRFRNHK
jgi:hypothetical protein